jgi:hypothetical protein
MRDESLQSTGQPSGDGTTCVHSRRDQQTSGGATRSLVATRARETLQPVTPERRVSAVSSSALLMHCARALFSARIPATSEPMLPGLGGPCELLLNRLATLCCPSDCEHAALGLSMNENECSCSVSAPTPVASAWRGGTTKDHPTANRETTFHHWYTRTTGATYARPEDIEAAMGFPPMWTVCDASAMP